jgi:hypothetical protein
MQNDHLNTGPENKSGHKPTEELSTQDLVRRHMEDKNHVISDEEMESVRVGLPNNEEPTIAAEAETYFKGEDDADETKEDGENSARPTTPWDVVE